MFFRLWKSLMYLSIYFGLVLVQRIMVCFMLLALSFRDCFIMLFTSLLEFGIYVSCIHRNGYIPLNSLLA